MVCKITYSSQRKQKLLLFPKLYLNILIHLYIDQLHFKSTQVPKLTFIGVLRGKKYSKDVHTPNLTEHISLQKKIKRYHICVQKPSIMEHTCKLSCPMNPRSSWICTWYSFTFSRPEEYQIDKVSMRVTSSSKSCAKLNPELRQKKFRR